MVHVVTLTKSVCQADELANYLRSEDEETGHLILYDQHCPNIVPFEVFDRHIDMVLAATQIARGKSTNVNILDEL